MHACRKDTELQPHSPGANINWVDGLDRETSPQQNATQAQPEAKSENEPKAEPSEVILNSEDIGERGRNRTFNLLIPNQQSTNQWFQRFPKHFHGHK